MPRQQVTVSYLLFPEKNSNTWGLKGGGKAKTRRVGGGRVGRRWGNIYLYMLYIQLFYVNLNLNFILYLLHTWNSVSNILEFL